MERVEEIIALIDSIKRENDSNSEDFVKRLNDIKIRIDEIQDNKEDLNVVTNAITQAINTKLGAVENNVDNLGEIIRNIQATVNSDDNYEELVSQVRTLSDNFKSGFNSVVSFANKDADAKNLLLDRMDSLEKAVKSGAMIDTLRQRTDELVKGYENFISDSNLRHGNMVSALVDLKNKIDDYSSKNNYVFGSIEHSIGDASSKISELESTVSSNLGNVNSKLYSMGDDIQKILNDGFDHLKYLSSNISEAMNSNAIDMKTALECLKANILDYSGSLNNEFDKFNNDLFEKLSSKDDIQSAVCSDILANIKTLEESIADKINNYESEISSKFNEVNEFVGMLNRTVSEVKVENENYIGNKFAEISQRLDDSGIRFEQLMNGAASEIKNVTDTMGLISDKVSAFKIKDNQEDIVSAKDELLSSAASNAMSLAEKIQGINDSFENFKTDFSNNLESYLSGIKAALSDLSISNVQDNGAVNSFTEKLASIEALINNSDTARTGNYTELKSLLEDNKSALEYLRTTSTSNDNIERLEGVIAQYSSDKDAKIDALKELVSEYKMSVDKLSEDIQSKSAYTASEISELKMIANDVLPTRTSIEGLSELISNKISESNTSVGEGISGIKTYLDNLSNAIHNAAPDYDDSGVQRKLTELSEHLNESFAGYEQALSILSTRVEEYSNSVDQVLADSKAQSEVDTTAIYGIKDKFEALSTQMTNLVGNSGLIEILADIRKQFNSVITEVQNNKNEAISDLKETIEAGSGDLSSRILDLVQNIASLESSISSVSGDDASKGISEIKEELNSMLVNINSNIDNKMSALTSDLVPLQDAVKVYLGNDFAGTVSAIKEQIELSYVKIITDLGAKLDSINSFDKIEESYKDLVYKLSDLELLVKESNQTCLDSVGNDLAVFQNMIENAATSNEELRTHIQSEILRIEEKINEFSATTRTPIIQELENIKDILNSNKPLDVDTLLTAIMPLIDNEELFDLIRGLNKNLADQIILLRTDSEVNYKEFSDLANSVKNTVEYTVELLKEKFENANANAKNIIQNIGLISDKIDELSVTIKETSKSDFDMSPIINGITDLKSALKQISLNSEVLDTYEQTLKVLDSKLDVIAMNDNSEDMNINFQQIKDSVDSIHKAFSSDNPLYNSIKAIDGKLDVIAQSGDSDLTSSVEEIKADVEELKASIQENESKLDKFVKTLDSKIDIFVQSSLDDTSSMTDLVNEGIDELSKKISDEVLTGVEKINQRLSSTESIFELRTGNIESKIDEFGNNVKENVSANIDKLNQQISNIENSIVSQNGAVDELKQQLTATESNLGQYAKTFDAKLDEISQFDSVNQKLDSINGNVESGLKIAELIKELNSKVDILAMSDDSELLDEMFAIKKLVEEQINDTTHEDNVDSALHKIIDEIDKISNDVSEIDFAQKTKEIKDAVIEAIVSFTNEISFVEEAEELKDFVTERTNDLHRTLMDVKHQLSAITNSSGDMDFYTYTLQDVESDLAKLRLVVNEIANRAPQNELTVISTNLNKMSKSMDDLREAVVETEVQRNSEGNINDLLVSISSRVNKIVLSQEEVDQKILDQLQNNLEILASIDNKADDKKLEQLLHSIDQRLESTSNSMEVIRNVMMYLGEWMDGTTDTLSSIYDRCNYNEVIKEIKESIPDNTQLVGRVEEKLNSQESKLNEINNYIESRISQQDDRLDRIERQLDRIFELLSSNENQQIDTQKLENFEDKLQSISNNVEKLASYVD